MIMCDEYVYDDNVTGSRSGWDICFAFSFYTLLSVAG
jgi:hypothetical protein